MNWGKGGERGKKRKRKRKSKGRGQIAGTYTYL